MRIGLVGARGHTGAELVPRIARHPSMELVAAGSRQWAGERVDTQFAFDGDLEFADLAPEDLAAYEADAWVLALPNGLARPYVDALDASVAVVDLSADHRFDDAWAYGLPEHFRASIATSRRIANPGCYATGAQLALRPIADLLEGAPRVFGVSGYSGAGTTPNDRNDPEKLRDNLMPYSLSGHGHEREIGRHLGHAVHFMPHVASFFRGISLTLSATLREAVELGELHERFRAAFDSEPLLHYAQAVPQVRDVAGTPFAYVGGLAYDPQARHVALVATIDNLLKGAATQAIQNLNILGGLDEFAGILDEGDR